MSIKIVSGDYARHGQSILDLYNEVIVNDAALYEYALRDQANIRIWFEEKQSSDWPILVAENEQGQFMGFGSYGPYRSKPANLYTIEHSLYIDRQYRGHGVAKCLLQALIDQAIDEQYHVMVGAIDAQNMASIALHERFGFTHAGTIKHAAYKFDQWLDLAFYQLLLPYPNGTLIPDDELDVQG